jgi:soluble lytic murein transglycosylase-like protein
VSRRCTILLALAVMVCAVPLAAAEPPVPRGYRAVAEAYGVPSDVFYAVALAESGRRIATLAAIRPWPWTLNVAGDGRFYASRWAAVSALQGALAVGRTSVDVGLMQVNWRHHRAALGAADKALDPYRNLNIAAAILVACHRAHEDWWAAVGCYHAPRNPERAARYRDRVRAIWRDLPDSK